MKNKDLERSVEGAQKIVKVLNDRTRLKILFFLSKQERNVSELQSLVQRSHTATSHHLSKLKSNRMVSAERKGNVLLLEWWTYKNYFKSSVWTHYGRGWILWDTITKKIIIEMTTIKVTLTKKNIMVVMVPIEVTEAA